MIIGLLLWVIISGISLYGVNIATDIVAIANQYNNGGFLNICLIILLFFVIILYYTLFNSAIIMLLFSSLFITVAISFLIKIEKNKNCFYGITWLFSVWFSFIYGLIKLKDISRLVEKMGWGDIQVNNVTAVLIYVFFFVILIIVASLFNNKMWKMAFLVRKICHKHKLLKWLGF